MRGMVIRHTLKEQVVSLIAMNSLRLIRRHPSRSKCVYKLDLSHQTIVKAERP